MPLTTRELTPQLWPELERLFGERGACGGCWCMAWRIDGGGKLPDELKGAPAKQLLHDLVASGRARGILAFDGGEPVGWCSFGPRSDFHRLERLKSYKRSDVEGVWSITCFFIPARHRGRGVGRSLLAAAVSACRNHGARVVEGYPVPLTKDGNRLPAAFSWTGPSRLFEELGFEVVQATSASRPLVRLHLLPGLPPPSPGQ